ncbi:MAG: hypothetical protein WKF57_00860 [Nakamurella sp.]
MLVTTVVPRLSDVEVIVHHRVVREGRVGGDRVGVEAEPTEVMHLVAPLIPRANPDNNDFQSVAGARLMAG